MIILISSLTILLIIILLISYKEKYDYQKEYEYAQKRGGVVSGTVYVNDISENPGLGWVL
jgi:hypothetical protein